MSAGVARGARTSNVLWWVILCLDQAPVIGAVWRILALASEDAGA